VKPIALEKFLVDILQHQPAVARRSNSNYYGSLFNVDDVATILKHGRKQENPKKRIKYLQEWKLVKRTLSDGEWWTGVFKPNSTISVEEAKEAFAKGGFTLIIKELQSLWSSVHHVAWLLEAALGWRINVNLYMSPAGSQVPLSSLPPLVTVCLQGFEAHYDWMDGLILQLFGKKNWTIYDPPMAVYPRPDHVRRPTPDFLRLAKQEPDPSATTPVSHTNLSPQEFVLSAGDLVYVPRGLVHEATASVPSADDQEDLSLHLTFGIETATHYSVEVSQSSVSSSPDPQIFLHHFLASRDTDTMTLPPPSPPSSGTLSFSLQNDEQTSSLSLARSEGGLEDFLHLVLSGVSSSAAPVLRGAMGVTVMMLDIPQLNPLHTLPYAVREVYRALHLPTVLKFLIQRGFLKFALGGSGLTLFPGLDPTSGVYQSGDFNCHYLDPFLSAPFLSPDQRMVTLSLSERTDGQTWLDLLLQTQTPAEETVFSASHRFYNRTRAVELIESLGNWTEAEGQLLGVLHRLFESAAANATPQREDEIFCEAWKRMMVSVREEKSHRKKLQVAALKASGQKLRGPPGAATAASSPPKPKEEDREDNVHIEL
jgi:hypothetical protein